MPKEVLTLTQRQRADTYVNNVLAKAFASDSNGRGKYSDERRQEILKQAVEKATPALQGEVKRQLGQYFTNAVEERKPVQLDQAAIERNAQRASPREYVFIEDDNRPILSENTKSDQFIFKNFAAIERELRGDKPLGNSLDDQVEIFQAALRRAKDPEIREHLEVRLAVAREDQLEKQARSPEPARAAQDQPAPRLAGNSNSVESEVLRIVQESHRDLNQRNGAPLEPNLENRVTTLLEAIVRASNREVRQSLEENLSKTLAAAEQQRQNPAGPTRAPLAASAQAEHTQAQTVRTHQANVDAGRERQTNSAVQDPNTTAYSSNDTKAAANFVAQVLRENYSVVGSPTRWRDLSPDEKVAVILDASALAISENKTGAVNYFNSRLNELLAGGERQVDQNQLEATTPPAQVQPDNALDEPNERSRNERGRDPDGRAPEGR